MPGPGNRQPVGTRARLAPIYSLLTAAEIVPDEPGPKRWLNGIKYRRELCGLASARYVGCEDDQTEGSLTSTRDDADEVHVDPFKVETSDTCSAIGWQEADYVGRATRLLAASEAYRVEHEFWTGTQALAAIGAGIDYPDDQWLAQAHSVFILNATDDQDATTATAVKPGIGLGQLQSALGDCAGGGPGMIHMPPKMLASYETLGLVTPVKDVGLNRMVDGRGNRIVPGFGYSVNTGPDGNPAAAGKAWVYATGMVYVRRDDPIVIPDTYAQAMDRANNQITFRVERDYLLDWDRCCHIAVLVNDDTAND